MSFKNGSNFKKLNTYNYVKLYVDQLFQKFENNMWQQNFIKSKYYFMSNKVGKNEYVDYLWHDGAESQFVIEPPNGGIQTGGIRNCLFSFTVGQADGSIGWRHEETFNFQGLDHKWWQSELKSENRGLGSYFARFYNNIVGMEAKHGEFPIFLDHDAKPWRLKTIVLNNSMPRATIYLEEFR